MVAKIVSSLFFIGYIPFAPGTWGSLAVIPIMWILQPSPVYYLLILCLSFLLGLWSSAKCEQYWGKDSGRIVIDEFCGQMIALMFIPFTLVNVVAGFLLFRFFDILKPFPIRNIELALKGATAVMLDDVAAGVTANILMHLFIQIQ